MWKKGGNEGEESDPLRWLPWCSLYTWRPVTCTAKRGYNFIKCLPKHCRCIAKHCRVVPRVAPSVVLCFATAPLHRARTFLFGRGSTAPDDAGISGISRLAS